MRVPPIVSYRDPVQDDLGRGGELALGLQEAFTVLVRLRAGRQIGSDSDSFRTHVKALLTAAHKDLVGAGYSEDSIRLAIYAYVAFLDESILGSGQAMFSGWSRQPLQEEVFGDHTAGETFFQNLVTLLERPATTDTCDVIEVYQLCLLVGFKGRYREDPLQLERFQEAARQRIEGARGTGRELAAQWSHPMGESVSGPRDPWVKTLLIGAASLATLCLVTFVLYTVLLGQGMEELRMTASRVLG
ncbi:MAG: DotU family type IV/VI secretion system protein [Gemmatimonadetes bacterium]|nr:DotU family type IV/VI secretion system protein [Gemmatimonadota bacterium]